MTSLFNAIPPLLIVALAVFVLIRGGKDTGKRIFAFFLVSASAWSACIFILGLRITEAQAVVVVRCLNIFVSLLAAFWFHFCLVFLVPAKGERAKKAFITASYVFALVCSIMAFTPLFIRGVHQKSFGYFADFGPLYGMLAVYLITAIIGSYVVLALNAKKNIGVKRVQVKYILTLTVVFLFATVISFLPAMSKLLSALPIPVWSYLLFLYAALLTYAIIRHKLMDIDIVIRYTSIYAFLIGFIVFIYVSTVFFFDTIVARYLGIATEWPARLAASIIIALLFLPVRNLAEYFVEKVFFGSKYNYVKLLHSFSSDLTTTIELRQILESVAAAMHNFLDVSKVAVYLHNKDAARFEAKAFWGIGNDVRELPVAGDDPLIRWMLEHRQAFCPQLVHRDERVFADDIGMRFSILNASIFVPFFFDKKLVGFLTLSEKRGSLLYTENDMHLLRVIGDAIAIAVSNALTFESLKKNYFGTIEAFASAIELKDKYTWGHSERVMGIARQLAVELAMTREDIDALQYAAVLHDIGKITVENSILNKQGRLTEEEYAQVKLHPSVGASIIESIEFLAASRPIVRHHHERWDGKGYPDGLRGEDIPLLARILSVADAFEAITASRPYQAKRSLDEGVEEVVRHSGTQFDPRVVECLVAVHGRRELAASK